MNYLTYMKVINSRAQKDPETGKNIILIELDEDDVVLLGDIIRSYDEDVELDKRGDKDDRKFMNRLKHNKEQIHKAFTIVRPS